jgi:GNAT superfamily N-acetyltransferase
MTVKTKLIPDAATMEDATIRLVQTEAEVAECYPLMRQLRPKLSSEREFIERWKRQAGNGYRLSALWVRAKPVALAGYRISENLYHGLHLYVDDLVTDGETRGQGHGAALLAHLKAEAKTCGCTRLVLDSGMANSLGHRFYYREGLLAEGLHFNLQLI